MTVEELKSQTRKDLAGMAKNRGVSGWHTMRKDELVRALNNLYRRDRRKASRNGNSSDSNGASRKSKSASSHCRPNSPNRKTNGRGRSKIRKTGHAANGKRRTITLKNLALGASTSKSSNDVLNINVVDAFWLHASWELKHNTISRAEAGMGIEWHSSKPVIRVLDVSSDENRHSVEKVVQDVEIHGGVNHWYIKTEDPPGVYQLQIGYLAPSGKFFSLARSGIVETPSPDDQKILNEGWQHPSEQEDPNRNGDKKSRNQKQINNEPVENLRRPMNSYPLTDPQSLSVVDAEHDELKLELDAELIVYGTTKPDSKLTISGEAIELLEDGSFTLRLGFNDGRQVIPATVTSAGRTKQQTVVLAVERNTKKLELQHFDTNDLYSQ